MKEGRKVEKSSKTIRMFKEDCCLFTKLREEEDMTHEKFMNVLLQSYMNSTLVKAEKEKCSVIISQNNALRQVLAKKDEEIRIINSKLEFLLKENKVLMNSKYNCLYELEELKLELNLQQLEKNYLEI